MKKIVTNTKDVIELEFLLTTLVALGYKIHHDDISVKEYLQDFSSYRAIRLSEYVSGSSFYAKNALLLADFLLEAARMKFGPQPTKVKLNDGCTAVITKEEVTVGCQTFTHASILEVAKAINAL